MTTSPDPVRLRARLAGTSKLGRALQAAQADVPDDKQIEALERSVFACVGVTAAAATATLVKAAPASTGGLAAWFGAGSTKLVVAVLVTSAALGGGTLLVLRQTRATASKQSSGSKTTSVKTARPSIAPIPPPLSEPGVTATPIEAPTEQPAPAVTPVPTKAKPSAPSRERRAVGATVATDDEIPLLNRAHQAQTHDPATALVLAEEHKRRFPESSLDQERELIAITALVDLGRVAEARRRAEQFTKRYPTSAYGGRVQTLVNSQSK